MKNELSIGENYGKIYGIIRYPQKVEMEWLLKIANISSSIVSIGVDKKVKKKGNARNFFSIDRKLFCCWILLSFEMVIKTKVVYRLGF